LSHESPYYIIPSKKIRKLRWQCTSKAAYLGVSDVRRLRVYDCRAGGTGGLALVHETILSEPINDWSWLDSQRIALLLDNGVQLCGLRPNARPVGVMSCEAPDSRPLGVGFQEKRKVMSPVLVSGDTVYFAILTEPCLQTQVCSAGSKHRGVNETLARLRGLQGQIRQRENMEREGVREDDGGKTNAMSLQGGGKEKVKAPVVTEDAGSVGIGNNSIEVIDLCGKLGLGSESDPAASPSSLLDSLIQNCSRLKVPSLDTSVPSPDQQAKLVVSRFMAGGAARREVVLTTFAQDGRPSLLAASRTHLALADPWRSILHVFFLPDRFARVATTEKRMLELPVGFLPRGLVLAASGGLYCLATQIKRGKGSEEGSATSWKLLHFPLQEPGASPEAGLPTCPPPGGPSCGPRAAWPKAPSSITGDVQLREKADIVAMVQGLERRMNARFDALEARLDGLARHLGAL